MFVQVRELLARHGYLINPVVYFDTSIPEKEIAELTKMVESLKGKVVHDRNAVGLTHIVYPFGPEGDPDDGQEYLRTQRILGERAVVHTCVHRPAARCVAALDQCLSALPNVDACCARGPVHLTQAYASRVRTTS